MMIQTNDRVLTKKDICDKCTAPAKVIATFVNGELMFCGHHARFVRKSLQLKSVSIYDPENELDLV